MDYIMGRIVIALFLLLSSYSVYSNPWITGYKKYEILLSQTVHFISTPYIISTANHIVQKELAECRLKLSKESSRKEKITIQNHIAELEKLDKKLSHYYEISSQYFNIEYGAARKLSLGLGCNLYQISSYEDIELLHKIIISPYVKYSLYKGKKLNVVLSSKFNNVSFNNQTQKYMDLGISLGNSSQKKTKEYLTFYDFNFSPNNFYKFTTNNGIKTQNGYLGIISLSYFKTIGSAKNIHSNKVRLESFISKKLYKSDKSGPSIFISYFQEYSKYSNIRTSSGIQIGFYYK